MGSFIHIFSNLYIELEYSRNYIHSPKDIHKTVQKVFKAFEISIFGIKNRGWKLTEFVPKFIKMFFTLPNNAVTNFL